MLTQKYPFVSVVIPSFNAAETILDCLHSLLEAQDYPPEGYEVIVADNGSSDGTPERIAAAYPQVRIVRTTEKGSAYARNAGLAIARGSLLLSTDADCRAYRNWIREMVVTFEEAPTDVAAIAGHIAPFSTDSVVERFVKAWVAPPAKGSAVQYAATPSAAFRTDILREMGGFDGTAGHDDSDLGIRLTKAGYRVLHYEGAAVWHRNPVTLTQLFHHRRKYGKANFLLAQKHPDLFGPPEGNQTLQRLRRETVRRVLGDLVKLPLSLVRSSHGRPPTWPVADAVLAVGNYAGFREASRQHAASSRP